MGHFFRQKIDSTIREVKRKKNPIKKKKNRVWHKGVDFGPKMEKGIEENHQNGQVQEKEEKEKKWVSCFTQRQT